MQYEKPIMEVVKLKEHDVITESSVNGTQTKPGEDDYDFGCL